MTIPAPNLDDRRFQELVDEAKRMVQQRCPEWTDHNVSDPGVTLIETFAFMVDQLLYRLNRVPDRLYVKLLELIGVRRFGPAAALADVTFWLSAPQDEPVYVPAGTEVATARTDVDEPISFTVVEPLEIPPSAVAAVATASVLLDRIEDLTSRLNMGDSFPCFSLDPTPGDTLLVGLTAPTPSCAVLLRIDCRIEGVGVDPRNPPLVWEAWAGNEWRPCEVERDETGGLNRRGDVIVHVPEGHSVTTMAGRRAAWLRCRVVPAAPGQPAYHRSPQIDALVAGTVGGTAATVNADVINGEVLGVGDGTPGQRFKLQHSPVAPSSQPPVVEVAGGEGWNEWTSVETFAFSGPDDLHFDLDELEGVVSFGPAVREQDGTLRRYGAAPSPGAVVRLRSYRAGGGAEGNVAAGAIRVLKGAIPFVTRVENQHPAVGGVAAEDIESAKRRGPLVLRTRDRAITASDYETLTREVAPDVARVACLSAAKPGTANLVRVLVVPAVTGNPDGDFDLSLLMPSEETLEVITRHLDVRRAVGTQVFVQPPMYQAITVVARMKARPGHSAEVVATAARRALFGYYHPLTGGPDGTGWPFGRSVHVGEAHAVLQKVRGIDIVEEARLFPADPISGERAAPVTTIELDEGTLVFSYQHRVLVEPA